MQRMYNCLPISSALWQEWMSLNCKILTKMWFIVSQNVIHSEQDQWHCIFSEPRVLEIWCCTLRISPIEDSLHCTLTLKNWNILLSFSSITIFHIFHAQSCFDWKCWKEKHCLMQYKVGAWVVKSAEQQMPVDHVMSAYLHFDKYQFSCRQAFWNIYFQTNISAALF